MSQEFKHMSIWGPFLFKFPHLVDIRLTKNHLPLPLHTGIKGMHYNAQPEMLVFILPMGVDGN